MRDTLRRSAMERGITRIVGILVTIPAGILLGWIGALLVKIATS